MRYTLCQISDFDRLLQKITFKEEIVYWFIVSEILVHDLSPWFLGL